MGAGNIEIREQVPASRKLDIEAARDLLSDTTTLVIAKGKKVERIDLKGADLDSAARAMLGPTGNLRAPTLKVGETLIVGFDEDSYRSVLG